MHTNKALIALVTGMGVVILVMLGLVAYGLTRSPDSGSGAGLFAPSAAPSAAVTAGPDVTVSIPPGSSIASVERDGGLLMVHVVDDEDRSMVLFVDPADGRIVRRMIFSSRAPGTR
jgi:hypothetical protein